MRVGVVGERPITIGWLIGVLVLVLALVFMAIGRLDIVPGALIAALGLARLV